MILPICWYLLLFLLENVLSNNNDLTVVVTKNKSQYKATCVITGNSTNRAVDWISNMTPKPKSSDVTFAPLRNVYNCDISNFRESCDWDWNRGEWILQNSLKFKLGPVFDYRWEKFRTVYTNIDVSQELAQLKSEFEIHFSIRGKEGHIFLCNKNFPPSSACYWIIINGWAGSSTVIRKCNENEIPKSRSTWPKGSCSVALRNNTNYRNILHPKRWVHFTLKRTNNSIELHKIGDDDPIIRLTDVAPLNEQFLIANSRGDAYWKLHEYEYIFTTSVTSSQLGPGVQLVTSTFCVSMFVNMCAGCKLVLNILRVNNDIVTSMVYTSNNIEWQYLKIYLTDLKVKSIFFEFSTVCENCENPYWAIDSFQFCNQNEVRVLTKYTSKLEDIVCQIVETSEQIIYNGDISESVPEVSCPPGSFGNTCENCDTILKSTCSKHAICNLDSTGNNVCRCSPGYTGTDCQQQCSNLYYGHACKEKCGYCQYTQCNLYSGDCHEEKCVYDFRGSNCKTPPMPILNVPPSVVSTSHTSCIVQVLDSSYIGNPQPYYYKIQYRAQRDDVWTSLNPVSLNYAQQIEIVNLNVSTKYYVRGVLVLYDGNSYELDAVPKVLITTTCAFVEINDVNIITANTSAMISIRNTSETCISDSFKIWVNDVMVKEYRQYQFNASNLKPFTNYTLTVRNIYFNGTLVENFKTDEGASSKVLNVTTNSDSTNIIVSWEEPKIPNGIVRYYEVSHQYSYGLACERPTINYDDSDKRQSYGQAITLQNLVPFSEYIIKIAPVTTMSGEEIIITAKTQATDAPDENELPSIRNVTVANSYVDILLNEPNCTVIKGPIVIHFSYQCFNTWCSGIPLTNNFSQFDFNYPIRIPSLAPYTIYNMEITVSRSIANANGPKLNNNITTLPSVPNKIRNIIVYTKDETSISARFPLPYPPTGILFQYHIQYCYNRIRFPYYEICDNVDVPAKECSFWPHYQCVTIYRLIPNTSYRFQISAQNMNTKLGEETKFSGGTWIEAPSAPLNLSIEWDEYYNLTIRWIHPDISNGPISNFTFQLFKSMTMCHQIVYPVNEEKYSYDFMAPVDRKCYSSEINIFGFATTTYSGTSTSTRTASPPVTPTFIIEPNIVTITNVSMAIDFENLTDFESESLMYIIMTPTSSVKMQGEYEEKIWKKAGLSESSSSWIAAEYNYNFLNVTSKLVIIGNGRKFQSSHLQREIHNRALIPVTNYTITILLTNTFMDIERHSVHRISATTVGMITEALTGSANYALFALLLLLIVPVVIWFVVKKAKENKGISWNALVTMVNAENSSTQNPDVIPLSATHRKKSNPAITSKNKDSIILPEQTSSNIYSKPIKIIEFENYVKESVLNGELERQHQLFPRGQTKPWEYGVLPQNKSKNRYNNLIAYDHTRVKLEKINDDEFSDYINANYVEGYKSPNAYIATQGPKPATVNDFWRMIWQENVQYIVMLANVIEGGKKKSEQYWPNINDRITYGNIEVQYTATRVFADYEYRTFWVQQGGETRKVEHLHFTSWPDHGVPLYCQSLVPFLRKLLTIPHGSSPVVVHCSAGVGRTGTIILSDLCLRMAAREGMVDVLKHQHHIREQRVNMVDNLEQYKLVHLVLLECLIAPQTSFTCDETIEKSITKILETDTLQHHIEYLHNTDWQDNAMQPSISFDVKPQWALKNRFLDLIPSGVGRIYLTRYPVSDEYSDYINAIEVDGFRAPQRFIATQQPLPHTVCDFWRMIDEKEVLTILCLNKIDKEDKTSCVFWPTKLTPEMKPVPFITITFQNKTKKDFYNITTVTLHNTKTKKVSRRSVQLICLRNWAPSQVVPETHETLITIWEEMETLTRGKQNPIVVTCHNGVTACGLFLALTFVVEKIQLEQQCDVCLAVRTIRRNQKKFVTKKEQFVFLYKATLVYLSAFELYSNFNSIIKN